MRKQRHSRDTWCHRHAWQPGTACGKCATGQPSSAAPRGPHDGTRQHTAPISTWDTLAERAADGRVADDALLAKARQLRDDTRQAADQLLADLRAYRSGTYVPHIPRPEEAWAAVRFPRTETGDDVDLNDLADTGWRSELKQAIDAHHQTLWRRTAEPLTQS